MQPNNMPRRATQYNGMQTTIPFAQAVNIRQTAPNRSVVMSGKEQFASYSVSSTTISGGVQNFDINPARLEGTRLNQVARSFQEYRVRRLHLTLVTNLPTTAGGSIVIGSTSNPDQLITNTSQVFALNGAQMASMYVPVVVNCNYSNNWLKIDPDSDEDILTTCSRIAIALQSTASISGTAVCPLLLDWTIEFRGNAIQAWGQSITTFAFPSTNVSSVDATYAIYLALQTGETLPIPNLVAGRGYEITGSFTIKNIADDLETAKIIMKGPTVGGTAFYFYDDVESFQNGLPIRAKFEAGVKYSRFIVEPLN